MNYRVVSIRIGRKKSQKNELVNNPQDTKKKMYCYPQDNAFVPLIYMGDESKGPRAVAAYPEKHPSYFPYADNRS